jgi:hypothetical protein
VPSAVGKGIEEILNFKARLHHQQKGEGVKGVIVQE